jgi:hypothetical protein
MSRTPISPALIRGSMRNYVCSHLQNGSNWTNLIVYVEALFAAATLVGFFGWLRDKKLTSIHRTMSHWSVHVPLVKVYITSHAIIKHFA